MIPLLFILIGWSKLLLLGPPPDRRRAVLLTIPLPVCLCLFPGGGRLLRRFLQFAPTFILLLRFVSPLLILFDLVLLLALLRPLLWAFGFLLPPPPPPRCPPLLPPFPGGAMMINILCWRRGRMSDECWIFHFFDLFSPAGINSVTITPYPRTDPRSNDHNFCWISSLLT